MLRKRSLLFLMILLPIGVALTAYSLNRTYYGCQSTQLAVSESEYLVNYMLGVRGGLSKSSMGFTPLGEQFSPFEQHETIAVWRLREAYLISETNPRELMREPEYTPKAIIDVLFADGTYLTASAHHTRFGYAPSCYTRPIEIAFTGPINYLIEKQAEPTLTTQREFSFGDQNAWGYSLYTQPGHSGNLISISVNRLNSPYDLRNFATFSEETAKRLVWEYKELDVQVVFSQPIALAKVKEIAAQHHLSDITIYVNTENILGNSVVWPVTIKGDLERFEIVHLFKSSFAERDEFVNFDPAKLQVEGVISVVGRIPSTEFDHLLVNEYVRLLDITPMLVREDIFSLTGRDVVPQDMMGVAPIGQSLINLSSDPKGN